LLAMVIILLSNGAMSDRLETLYITVIVNLQFWSGGANRLSSPNRSPMAGPCFISY